MRILVTYASSHGSTQEIAERIAARIEGQGLSVDCRPVGEADAMSGYDAVVVGSAVHDQAWLTDGSRFITGHLTDLSAKPLWLFSVGMPGALPRPFRKRAARAESAAVVAPFLTAVSPRGVRLFSGVVSKQQFPAHGRALLRLMGGRYGDFRDWPAIEAWADTIATELRAAPLPGH
jgi:menaquinone-dependent protoporphyrinogen oxidase